ncbi:THO complex subunit 4A [Cytospora mali]|uniref:THO complex subunit 4A n=1 Tax=Cytospora mali TaxID=578113 RepID=A0A194UQK7_CYTMA|nr:THO complex subunit 4A [Valsa mali var. pyri (nom. inval.)]
MDRSLDEILASRDDRKGGRPRGGRGGRGGQSSQRQREPRNDFPRDGVRKSYRDDAPRNLDSEWVHDRFEDNGRRPRQPRRGRDRESPAEDLSDLNGTKIRVENVHYDLTKEDLEDLFNQMGPVLKLDILYDRAGRSTGIAFVTYESYHDAREAIKEYDGANANGQPIRLSIVPPQRQRNAFDTAVMPGRPLAERVTLPPGRNRSLSPGRDLEDEATTTNGNDQAAGQAIEEDIDMIE